MSKNYSLVTMNKTPTLIIFLVLADNFRIKSRVFIIDEGNPVFHV